VLAVLAILGVIFALQTIFRTRELRSLQMQATQANGYRMGVEALANDAVAYSKQNPNADLLTSCSPSSQTRQPLIAMNESETNLPVQTELMDQIVALRHQVFNTVARPCRG